MRRDRKYLGGWWRLNTRRAWILVVAAGLHLSTATTVWAQRRARLDEEETGGMVYWGLALVILLIVCVPAFVNLRRVQK